MTLVEVLKLKRTKFDSVLGISGLRLRSLVGIFIEMLNPDGPEMSILEIRRLVKDQGVQITLEVREYVPSED